MLDRASLKHTKDSLQDLLSVALHEFIWVDVVLNRSILQRIDCERPPKMDDRIPKTANPVEMLKLLLGHPAILQRFA